MTRTGVVGVLATSQTIASVRFARLVETFGSGVRVVPQPCPGLVEQVESGDLAGAETRALVCSYVEPLLQQGADTIVLGCTHYPFVSAVIESVAGSGVTVINPAAAVARELRRRLEAEDLTTQSQRPGRTEFLSSGSPNQLERLLDKLGLDATSVAPLGV
jgi:glutamate racemase